MNPLELNELIEGCVRNNRAAQEKLYKHFYADMFITCQRYAADPHDALTILNDAFLKVFKNISQYQTGMGNFKPWLKTIVINTAIDHVRRLKKEAIVIHIDQLPTTGDDDFQLNLKFNQDEILQHVKLLPAVTRVVINLFAFDGYSHKDIAIQLNITETTSRWHLSEGRKRLKNSMQLK